MMFRLRKAKHESDLNRQQSSFLVAQHEEDGEAQAKPVRDGSRLQAKHNIARLALQIRKLAAGHLEAGASCCAPARNGVSTSRHAPALSNVHWRKIECLPFSSSSRLRYCSD